MKKDDASLTEQIGFYQEQVRIVDRIWWYFYTVTFAILGFTIGSTEATKSTLEVSIICIGYVAFSFGSAASLWKGQSDLHTFASLVKEYFDIKLTPVQPHYVLVFQAVIACAVVVAVIAKFQSR